MNCVLKCILLLLLWWPTSAALAAVDLSRLPPPAARVIDFSREIQPILENSCLKCHEPDKAKGKLSLDTRANALKGGDNAPDIIPGDSSKSPLIHFTARLIEDSEMPPVGKGDPLTKQQVSLLRAWIDQGAKWPDTLTLHSAGVPIEATAASGPLPPPAQRQIDFVKDVQPILATRCYDCHGPKKQEAQFRLDTKDIALRGGELGPAIIPGKSADSLLIQAVAGVKPDFIMPKKGDRLSPEQVGLLRAWIDQGAIWPDGASAKVEDKRNHWAFKAPIRPQVPLVQRKNWVQNPIDSFVLARLEKEKLKSSPEADRVTLIRRLSLDLVGLPPTIEEVNKFVADRSPGAYEKQVERLLASPHYGERWGRHWLDAARYADSDGFEKDKSRQVWFYRDYVINAFNRDLPYDRFIIEQLAGDLLPNAPQDQIVATGFLRNSMVNEEGGIDPEQFRMDAMFDRMECIGKGVLGLTIQCAQCHNHKFDPITQEEYYRLFAFLNNDNEVQRVVYTPPDQMQVADVVRQMREIEGELRHRAPDWEQRMAAWEQQAKSDQPTWVVLPLEYQGDNDERYLPQPDGSYLAQGYAPTKHTP